jgi:hypothetical protein
LYGILGILALKMWQGRELEEPVINHPDNLRVQGFNWLANGKDSSCGIEMQN